jgi:DNA-binding NarL/FixJ family response regulator
MSIIPDLVRNIRDAAANPDRWTWVFGLLLSDARDGALGLTFYREEGGASRTGVSLSVSCGTGVPGQVAVRLGAGGPPKGKLAVEFRFEDEAYGIKTDCRSCKTCSACGNLQQVREEIAASIRLNRAILAGGIVTASLRTVLNALPDPAFVLMPDGVVAWRNEAAQANDWADAFASDPGKPFVLTDPAVQAAFRAALSEASRAAGAPAKIVNGIHRKSGAPALAILKAVVPSLPFKSPWVHLFQNEPQTVVVLREKNSRPSLSSQSLRDLYSLTSKEADLAVALAQGETLRIYANRTGVAFETARWHSKKLMQKMACRSQQEILHALLYTNALFSIVG